MPPCFAPSKRRAAVLLFTVAAGARLFATTPDDAATDALIAKMTLEEKVALVHGRTFFSVPGVPRLGVPGLTPSDGPHGVGIEMFPDRYDSAERTDDFSTCLPAGTQLAATWNPALAYEAGRVLGAEARARGKDIILAPGINLMRTPLCGRNFEYAGEDPYLVSRLAPEYIRGVQTQGVAACIKHYALNNQETDRMRYDVQVDERTLRELYLPGFEAAVKTGGVLTVMAAFNRLRGEHCCHNDHLLNGILKKEWGFSGLVMSDWGGVHDTAQAARNGLDLEMGTEPLGREHLNAPYLAGLKAGTYAVSDLDDKVRRGLRVRSAIGIGSAERPKGAHNTPEHAMLVRRAAEEGIVLLKNTGALLPLDAGKLRSVVIVGDNATRKMSLGGGSSQVKPLYEITPLDGIVARLGSGVKVAHFAGYSADPKKPAAGREEMMKAAAGADAVIYVGGLNKSIETETRDRPDMKLPFGQDALIADLVKTNPKTVVVMVAGSPVEMGAWLPESRALVWQGYAGQEAGNALARVLFGDVNPSGKLPYTLPASLSDTPAYAFGAAAYPGEKGVVKYLEGLLIGYRWYDAKNIAPLFPFGHGLSYTTFRYGKPSVEKKGDEVVVTVDITNTGARDGAEVVELYVAKPVSAVARAPKELKGFAKLALHPGETRPVRLVLDRRAFAHYDEKARAFTVEPGRYELSVAASSRDSRGKVSVEMP